MINEKGEFQTNHKFLPNGIPFMNIERFTKMVQKCEQCTVTLKNKKKYIIGEKIKFDTGFWTLEKICRGCGHVNGTRKKENNA